MSPVSLCWPALMDRACWPLQSTFYFSVSHGLNSVSWASQFFHLSISLSWTSVSCLKQIKYYEQILWGTEKKVQIFVIIRRHCQSSIATRAVPCLFLYWNYWGKHQPNNTHMKMNSQLRNQLCPSFQWCHAKYLWQRCFLYSFFWSNDALSHAEI